MRIKLIDLEANTFGWLQITSKGIKFVKKPVMTKKSALMIYKHLKELKK